MRVSSVLWVLLTGLLLVVIGVRFTKGEEGQPLATSTHAVDSGRDRPSRPSSSETDHEIPDKETLNQIDEPPRSGEARIQMLAVAENERPLGALRWEAEFKGRAEGHREYFRTSGVTDEAGRLELKLDERRVDLAMNWSVLLCIFAQDSAYKNLVRLEQPRIGISDIGTETFWSESLILSGRVIDVDGQPVADAAVDVTRIPLLPVSMSMNLPSTVFTDDAGCFAFYDDATQAEDNYVVEAYAAKVWSERVRVARDDRAIVIRAEPKARLKARFVARGGGRLESLNLGINHAGGRWSYDPDMPSDGVIDLHLRPGEYTIELTLGQGFIATILRRRGLILESGAVLDLGEVMLDHAYPAVEISLDPGGAVPPKRIEIDQFLEGRWRREVYAGSVDTDDPRVTIDVSELPADVEIRAEGYRTERLTLYEKNVALKLRRRLQLEISVPGLGPAPEGVEFRVQMSEPPDISFDGVVASGRLDPATAAVRLGAPHPGPFLVGVSAWSKKGDDPENSIFLFSSASQRMTVFDSEHLQKLVLTVQPEFQSQLQDISKVMGEGR